MLFLQFSHTLKVVVLTEPNPLPIFKIEVLL